MLPDGISPCFCLWLSVRTIRSLTSLRSATVKAMMSALPGGEYIAIVDYVLLTSLRSATVKAMMSALPGGEYIAIVDYVLSI